jgi:hypothetical protein
VNRLLRVCTALFVTTACTGADGHFSSVYMSVDTVGGVVHVRNAGDAPGWTAREVLRLGSVAGGDAEFGRVRSLTADPAGNIYVADNLAQQIRVFSEAGDLVRVIGRSGGGPGEFGNLYSLAWLGGRLAAMDPANARISLLTPEGEWVDGIQHFPITGPATFVRLHPLGDDGFYAAVLAPGQPRLPYVRFTGAGAADTIPAPQPPADAPATGVRCERPDGGLQFIAAPEGPGLLFGFPPAGGQLASAWTQHYRIAFIAAAGDTIRTLALERPPVPYPDSMWNRAQEPFREMHANFPGTRCEPASLTRPQARAALRWIMFDETGRLWVEAAAEGGGFAWDVFDTDGRLMGSFTAPPRAAGVPPFVRNNRLYQVETDEMDVQYVAVYRIEPAG